MKRKIVIFGAGEMSRYTIPKLKSDFEIISIVDNDERKWGTIIYGLTISPPSILKEVSLDIIIISSYWREIVKQLCEDYQIKRSMVLFLEDSERGYRIENAYGGDFYSNIEDNAPCIGNGRIHFDDNKKCVLFLAYYFPPLGSSPVQRTLKFVKYLSYMGYRIIVATVDRSDLSMDLSLNSEIPENVEVIRFKDDYSEKEFVPIKKRKKIYDFISQIEDGTSFIENWMKAERSQEYYIVPDKMIIWAEEVFKNIDKYINIDKVDVVYSTAPYWSSHMLAYRIKKKYGIPWVADYRDPWVSDYLYASKVYPFMTSEEIKWYRQIESKLTMNMDRIVIAGDNWKDSFVKSYGVDKERIVYISNGFDEEDFSDVERKQGFNEKFTLCYNGMLGYNRKPKYLLEVISEMIDNKEIDKESICWIFNGDIKGLYDEWVHKYDKYGIVIYNGVLEHKDSIRVAVNSDLMIMYGEIGEMASMNYPGKFYEYLRIGNPILCFSGKGSPQETILSETGMGVNLGLDDKEEIHYQITKYYRLWKENRLFHGENRNQIERFNRRELTKKLAMIIDSVK